MIGMVPFKNHFEGPNGLDFHPIFTDYLMFTALCHLLCIVEIFTINSTAFFQLT